MKSWTSLVLAATLLLFSPSVTRAEQSPREFIQETADQVLLILRDGSLSSDQKVKRLEGIAYQRFDFPTMARLVLARNWNKLTPEQQQEFVREFRQHLSVTYGKNIDNFRNESIEILSDREEARGDWTVKTKVLRGGEDIIADYRLRKIDGEWKIIDVVIERVSLVANFRSQLQDIVASRGADEMLRLLREKNASGQSILPDGGKPKSGGTSAS